MWSYSKTIGSISEVTQKPEGVLLIKIKKGTDLIALLNFTSVQISHNDNEEYHFNLRKLFINKNGKLEASLISTTTITIINNEFCISFPPGLNFNEIRFYHIKSARTISKTLTIK